MLDLQTVYYYGVAIVFLLIPVIFTVLLFKTAPYGRYRRPNLGSSLNPRLGWVLMELPCVMLFAWVYFQGVGAVQIISLLFFCLWELHYLQRTVIYPALMSPKAASMPVSIVITGLIFNIVNSSLNAIALTHLPSGYLIEWLFDPRFILGAIIFLLGFSINISSDHILRNLGKSKENGYKIPHCGLFQWISCPNYFGEILEWCGWALASWSLAGITFAIFTIANLAPRARAHHKWYQSTFPDYPKNRKALIPGIF